MTTPAIMPFAMFGPIAWWVVALNQSRVFLDHNEVFRRQTFRNRFNITGPNKVTCLSFPVTFVKGVKFKDVALVYKEKWPVLHRRSLQAAYGKAPYYEYYTSFLDDFFSNKEPLLLNKCLDSLQWVNRILKFPIEFIDISNENSFDCRRFDFEKKIQFTPYHQVFEDRLGFVGNSSILDLIFNLGPDSGAYLMNQTDQIELVASST
jgi:hypothetical protein